MARKALDRKRLQKLGKLINKAIKSQELTAKKVAENADVDQSHFSKVLRGERSLKSDALTTLCALLQLDPEEVFRLAGQEAPDRFKMSLREFTLKGNVSPFTLNVVCAPHFYDSALFMWLLMRQPFSEIGVECQLVQVNWDSIPSEVAMREYSVGFYNWTASDSVMQWSHLCLYKGYALISRENAAGISDQTSATNYLRKLKGKRKGSRPVLITIEHEDDLVTRLIKSEVFTQGNKLSESDFDIRVESNPEFALEKFRRGDGDLFLGGLPQRMAVRTAGFSEIVTFKQFPKFYTLNSLICSSALADQKKQVLRAIDALWQETCRRLYDDRGFRTKVIKDILRFIHSLGIERHSIVERDFMYLFSEDGKDYEVFATRPADFLEEITTKIQNLPS